MSILSRAQLLVQGKNYSGTGEWLDESGNGHNFQFGDGSTSSTFPVFATDEFTFDGAQYFSTPDHGNLDFEDGVSLTLIAVGTVTTANTYRYIASKRTGGGATQGYGIATGSTGLNIEAVAVDATGAVAMDALVSALVLDTEAVMALRRDESLPEVEAFKDGVGSGTPTTTATASLAQSVVFNIGAFSGTYNLFTGKVKAVALFREALTNIEIAAAGNQLAGLASAIAVTGTAVTGGVLESEIVTGGETIILTATNDTWVPTVGDDNAITNALIAGITSAGAEAAGWNAVVQANMVHGDIVRTSDTVVTVTLAAEAAYAITADETVTVTVPATALTGAIAAVAAPTILVDVDATALHQHLAGPGQMLQTGG